MSDQDRPSRRILVVDDQRDVRHLLATVLQVGGHRVESAADGREALEKLDSVRPEVVICDLNLDAAMDGFELARAIGDAVVGGRVHLIALTGSRRPEDEASARAAGFSRFFSKPVDCAELLRWIDGLAKASDC